ncbi:hypothetical protein ACS8Y6_17835 [Salinisphaera sp. RV14]|uniref:hypothetical protein n=2 Tax=unclassified Salinisphaera TaxID=2649847 RepID=UPI003F87A1D7
MAQQPAPPAAAVASRHSAEPTVSKWAVAPPRAHARLAWAPMDSLSPLKPERHHDASVVTITRASVPPPLNLKLPANTPRDVPLTNESRASLVLTAHSVRAPLAGPLATDAQQNTGSDNAAAAAPDTHLFNRNNGLRGFMAHNWLNKSVGVQGGLAIKDERLRQSSGGGLRGNMAVGMGVLLAF